MSRKTDIAYLAGIIDGEGCIRIKRSKPYKHLTGRTNMAYHCSISVRMVDAPAIQFLRDTLGGWTWHEDSAVPGKRRDMYAWQSTDADAERILRELLPYLRVKRANADNALAFRAWQAGSRKHRTKITGYRNFPNKYGTPRQVANLSYSDEFIAGCDAFYVTACKLNH